MKLYDRFDGWLHFLILVTMLCFMFHWLSSDIWTTKQSLEYVTGLQDKVQWLQQEIITKQDEIIELQKRLKSQELSLPEFYDEETEYKQASEYNKEVE